MPQPQPAATSGEPGRGEHAPLGADMCCPSCGYSLRGLTSRRCPECGLSLEFIGSDTPIIPWERRRELGRLRAYWQTLLLVMFRNRHFCRAVCRPVSYRDAQRFRWVCILHVFLPLVLALPILGVFGWPPLYDALEQAGAWFIGVGCACALLALLALTGVPSYFFHPRCLSVEQQNRAIALSYYGFAPLAAAPLGLVALVGGHVAGQAYGLDLVFRLLAVLWVPALLALCWFELLRLARHAVRARAAVLRLAVLVPPLWLLVGGLTLTVLPGAAYFVALVYYSLRGGAAGG